MELPIHSYWIPLVCLINGVTAVDDPMIVCNQTYYVEVGTQAVVSCEYDHSFLAVRWYFDGAEISFLRIDGTSKSGSGIENGDFDIRYDGSMIIKEVELKHEGRYKISVLHQSGTVRSKEIMVYAMVLLDEVVITNCRRSSDELCTKIPSLQRERTLLCVAKDSRPPVEIVWKTTLQNETVLPLPKDYSVDMDPSSMLYTSSSYLQYESNSFALEYFTCQVNGIATKNVPNVSLLLEGSGEFLQYDEDIQYVQKGSSFHIQCPKPSFQYALLKVTYSSEIEKLLMTSYPSDEGSQCLDSSKCKVGENGVVTIEEVSFEDEGSYECAFGNGVDSYIHVLNLIVVVSPSPPMTVIEGCEETRKCEVNGHGFGTLKCSLYGSRPPTNLSYEVSERSQNDIVIFNIRNEIVKAKGIGTFNTFLTANYEVKACDNPVQITCQAESKVHSDTNISEMVLTVDKEVCNDSSKTTMIVFLVLFVVLLFVVAIAASLFIIKRRKDSSKGSSPETAEKSEEMEVFLPQGENPSKESENGNKFEQSHALQIQTKEGQNSLEQEPEKAATDIQKSEIKDKSEKEGIVKDTEAASAENQPAEETNLLKQEPDKGVTDIQKSEIKQESENGNKFDTNDALQIQTTEGQDSLKQEPDKGATDIQKSETKDKSEKEDKLKDTEAASAENQPTERTESENGNKFETNDALQIQTTEGQQDSLKQEPDKGATDIQKSETKDKSEKEEKLTDTEEVSAENQPAEKTHTEKGSNNQEKEATHHHKRTEEENVLKEGEVQDIEPKENNKAQEEEDQEEEESKVPKMENKPQETEAGKILNNDEKDSGKEETSPQNGEAENQHRESMDSFDATYMEIKERHKDKKNSTLEVANDILKHLFENKITLNTVFRYVSFSGMPDQAGKKITFVFFLQSSIHLYPGEEIDFKCHQTFDEILQKALAQQKTNPEEKGKADAKMVRKFKEKILQELKSFPYNSEKRQKKESLARILLQVLLFCVRRRVISPETCVEMLSEEVKHKTLTQYQLTNTLNECLKEKVVAKEPFVLILQSLVDKNQMSSDQVKVILCECLKKSLIQQKTVITVLHSFVLKNQISVETFADVLQQILQTDKGLEGKFEDILCKNLANSEIQKDVFITVLQSLLTQKKINFPAYIDVLKRSFKDKLIDEKLFQEQFTTHLNNDKWNKENWIWVISSLTDKHSITEELRSTLLNLVVTKYQMSEKQMKAILKDLDMTSDRRKNFTSGVKF